MWLLACPLILSAHQGSTSYLSLSVDESSIRGRWEIPVADLDLALKLDQDNDHKVSANELQVCWAEVQSYALRHLKLSVDGAAQTLAVTNVSPKIQVFVDGASTSLDFVATNLAHPTNLEVEYRFMFDRKPLDRAFMQVECRSVTQTAVFTSDRPIQRFDLTTRRTRNEFLSFGWHGVHHIWIGLDHILFLVALLLPAVLRFERNLWRPVASFREAFLNVFKVVTAFTVAHSITLSLAALQVVALPSRGVESAIAISVLAAAANNVRVFLPSHLWLMAFAFGLIHGFGFANVLTELGLPRNALLLALVGFNLGVEAGQLALVSLFLPLAFAIRGSTFYRKGVMKLGSLLIIALAGVWLAERLFDFKILPT